MSEKIKRFRMKPDAEIPREGMSTQMQYVNSDATHGFFKMLVDEIELNVTFPANCADWDDFDFVLVIDDDFGQPYYPFYQYLNGKRKSFPFLDRVVHAYNEFMSSLPYLEEVKE